VFTSCEQKEGMICFDLFIWIF